MTAAIANFAPQMNVSIGNHDLVGRRSRADAEMGIKELEALRLAADLVVPEAAALAAGLVKAFSGALPSGDHIRLQQKTFLDGPQMRAAMERVLAVDIRATPGANPDAVRAEARMQRVLGALTDAGEHIHNRASVAKKF